MNDAQERAVAVAGLGVSEVEPGEDRAHDGAGHDVRYLDTGGARAAQHLAQRHAVDVLHGEEVAPIDATEVEGLHDVGVHQASAELGLAAEARDEVRVVGQMGVDDLHGRRAREAALRAVGREPHHSHAAVREPALQVVLAEQVAGARVAHQATERGV
jgi:hypothetical protein